MKSERRRLTTAGFAAEGPHGVDDKEAAMTMRDDRAARVTERAYEFARSGAFENMTSLERRLIQEGFADDMHWLEQPGVRRSLAELSDVTRELHSRAERPSI